MSKMAGFPKLDALEVIDELLKAKISLMFAQPVDPMRDNCPQYLELIKHPMDLGTVRKNVEENKYTTVAQWKHDMELIWSNSFIFNKKNSLLGLITREMEDQYHKLSDFLTDSPNVNWMAKLCQMQKDFNELMKDAPSAFIGKKKKSKVKDAIFQSYNVEPFEARRHFQPFARDELVALTEAINGLKVNSQIITIMNIIKNMEPNLVDDPDNINLDLNMLKPSTLHALKSKIEEFEDE